MIPRTTSLTTFDTPMEFSQDLTGSAVGPLLRSVLKTATVFASVAGSVAGLYLVKSAMGINLLPWNSPLHDLLYHLVR